MIDPITEHILHEDRTMKSLKMYMHNMKKAALRKDIKSIARLSKMLPETSLKSTKRYAVKLPNFREKYEEAKKAIRGSKILDKEVEEPASVAIAIVAASANKTVSDVMKTGHRGMPQARVLALLLPAGSQFVMPLIKLNFFILAIMSIYVTGGQIIVPAISSLLKTGGYLLGLIGKTFKGLGNILAKTTDKEKVEKAVEQVNDMMGTNLLPPRVFGLKPELVEKMKAAGMEFGPVGGEHLPGTAGLFFKAKK